MLFRPANSHAFRGRLTDLQPLSRTPASHVHSHAYPSPLPPRYPSTSFNSAEIVIQSHVRCTCAKMADLDGSYYDDGMGDDPVKMADLNGSSDDSADTPPYRDTL